MIRYLEWGESSLTTVVYNIILNSSASLCVSASPQWAPHIWPVPPSFCSSSHDPLRACKEIHPSPKSSGQSSLPQIWQEVLGEGGSGGSGWEWAKGSPVLPQGPALPQLTQGDTSALHCTVEGAGYSATWVAGFAVHLMLAVWHVWTW